MGIEKHVFFDLELTEVVMTIHRFMKRLDEGCRTISTHIEKIYVPKTSDEDNSEKVVRYTLIIIISRETLSKAQLLKIYDRMMGGLMMRQSKEKDE
jgi:hypothetical protein